jgi:hypothetical protein
MLDEAGAKNVDPSADQRLLEAAALVSRRFTTDKIATITKMIVEIAAASP